MVPGVPLEQTEWRLVELGGEPVILEEGMKPPHIVLDPDGSRVGGSGGCNRITGTFEQEGDTIRFGPIASTRMACPEPVMQRETAFLKALGETTRFELDGPWLVLLADDRPLVGLAPAA